jgi:MFS family permease
MRRSIEALSQFAEDRSLFGLVVVRGVSSVGDWLYLAALPILIYQETGDVALVGLMAAGRLLPWLILSIPAGIAVDRLHARTLLIASESIRAALMLLMGILAVAGAPLALILVAAVAAAGAGTFGMPAFGRFVPAIARDPEQLGRANVVGSGLDSLACVIGPGLAAVLIVSGGLELAFVLNGLSFLGVVAVLCRIRVPSDGRTEHATGVTRSGSEPVLQWSTLIRAVRRPLAVDAAVSFAAGLLMVLPVLAMASLGGDDAFAGVLSLTAGVGGVVGAAAAASFVNTRPGRGMSMALAASIVGLVVVAVGTSPTVLVSGIAMAAAAVVALDTLNLTQVQRTLDERLLGRGLGLINTSAAVWVILGSLLPTLLVEAVGLPLVILGSALLVLLLGGLGRCPSLRAQRFRSARTNSAVPTAMNPMNDTPMIVATTGAGVSSGATSPGWVA